MLDSDLLAKMFTTARTHSAWQDRAVDPALLRRAWDLAILGPSGGNGQPLRALFVTSADAKAKLLPTLMAGNVEKTRTAPVTAIFAYDLAFYDRLPQLFPERGEAMRASVAGLPEPVRERMAVLSASLEIGYFILAARALGLDCGPMGGFNGPAVDAAFFTGEPQFRTTLLVNLGYGDATGLYPRLPRLAFDDACRIV